MTLRDGQVVWDLNGLAWKDWREAGNYRTLNQYGEERRGRFPRRSRQSEPGAAGER
jgi:hypothetical protein